MRSLTLTPSQAAESPISRLQEDILWKVFLENTGIYNDNRLTTTRHTSQVCRRWRIIMLNAASIWGRCIDLKTLHKSTHDWFQEVLFRSGNALLWITGPINTNKTLPPDFFFTFVNEKWDRIQRLNISDHPHSLFDFSDHSVPTQYWSTLFKKPAPFLEEFVFYYTGKTRVPPLPDDVEDDDDHDIVDNGVEAVES